MKVCTECNSYFPNDTPVCPRDGARLRVSSQLQPNETIRGKYVVLSEIGSGGMATVYRVQHQLFGEIRALKIVNDALAHNDEFLRRFLGEAVVMRKLRHPNIISIDDVDTYDDGRPFIVMEYVDAESLSQIIRRGPLPAQRAIAIAAQVASALEAAHQLNITHRDIKPDNIIVRSNPDGTDTVKVLDFGIATLREGFGRKGLTVYTQTGMLIGTPQYMSPEQCVGKAEIQIDGRSDIYSLGIVLFQMLTGVLPFSSDTPIGYALCHVNTPPATPEEALPGLKLPAGLSAVLAKALAKDREHRFQTAGQFREALQQCQRPAVTLMSAPASTSAAAPRPAMVAAEARPQSSPSFHPESYPELTTSPAPPDRPSVKPVVFSIVACVAALILIAVALVLPLHHARPTATDTPGNTTAGPTSKQDQGTSPANAPASVPTPPATTALPSESEPRKTSDQPPASSSPLKETPPRSERAKPSSAPAKDASSERASASPPPATAPAHPSNRVRLGADVVEGLVLHKVTPIYPNLAKQARVQGPVVLDSIIGTDGSVKSLQVKSGHPMLTEAAITAVSQWKYKPYVLNGTPVEVETTIQVNFHLEDAPAATNPAPATTSPAPEPVYRVGADVAPPKAVFTPDPQYGNAARQVEGTCVLTLVVGSDGTTRNLQVTRSLDPDLDQRAIEAVRHWRFQPASKAGKPVAVQINVDVHFHLY